VGGRFLAIIAATVCIGVAAAPVVEAGHPAQRCGSMTAAGKRVKVFAVTVSCSFAKTWTQRFLARKRRPSGYRCTRVNQSGVKLVMTCKRSSSRYFYAERP
jgi:hypothetical protein